MLRVRPLQLQVQLSAGEGAGVTRLVASRGRARVQIETTPVMRGAVHALDFADLYAGKLAAALSRQHPRDLFDVGLLLGDEQADQVLWRTFLVYLTCSPKPAWEMLMPRVPADFAATFEAHFKGMTVEPIEAEALLSIHERLLARMAGWLDEQSCAFLRSIEAERPDFNLIGLPHDYLAYLAENRIRLKDRIELLLNLKILRMQPFDDWEKRKSVIHALQMHYYDKALQKKNSAMTTYREALERGNFKGLLDDLTISSMVYLKRFLHQHIPYEETFDSENYRKNFGTFMKRYPIIGSSTHSIVNSIKTGAILDYAIIDEASQQDIVPGILALGCARNLIVVGDRKQLPHIPANLGIAPPIEFHDCDKYSLLDSCIGIFGKSIPMTLLKEHYRCHPRIIQFCNQQFYDGQLIPMTHDAGEKALKLIVTAKGNHTRKYSNLRELDSLLETLEWDGESEWDEERHRGFIAPYNAQVSLSRTHLPTDFVKDTVHKFQGRECDEIVFSTVLDKKRGSQRNVGFVDDPHLVNVAVSRAKNKFILVTGDDVFSGSNGHIAALVRYIDYYADENQIHRAPVVSAFDLLYKEYDRSLERLNARLRSSDSRFKSEQIVARILRDTLSLDAYRAMTFHSQVALIQLVSSGNEALTPRERDFMKNRASCDFVLYFRVGRMPLGVIEVDGGHHDTSRQAERDALKNSILGKSGIPLLRLKTVESHIEEKIRVFLAQWGHGTSTV